MQILGYILVAITVVIGVWGTYELGKPMNPSEKEAAKRVG